MKRPLAILLAAALLPLSGCSSKGEAGSIKIADLPDTISAEEADLPENQALYRRTSYQYQDGELTCKYYNDFDEHDNLVRSEKDGDPEDMGMTDVYSYVYDENGNVTEKTKSYIDPPSTKKNCSFYDRYYYYPDGTLEYQVDYTFDYNSELLRKNYIKEYDSHGNEILYLRYSDDGSVYYRSENKCEYDGDGNLVKETWHDEDASQVIEFTYDEAGNMLTEVRTEFSDDSFKNQSYVMTLEYSYDSNGNKVKQTTKDSYDETTSIEYEYDDRNRVTSKEVYLSRAGTHTTYTYEYEDLK